MPLSLEGEKNQRLLGAMKVQDFDGNRLAVCHAASFYNAKPAVAFWDIGNNLFVP